MDVDTVVPPAQPLAELLPVMRSTVVAGMVMMLKSYLKDLYSLSEEYVSIFLSREW